MTCPTDREIARLVDEPGTVAPALREHIDSCPRCRAVRARLREAVDQVHRLEVTPPADLDARVLSRLKESRPRQSRGLGLAVALGGGVLAVAVAVIIPNALEGPRNADFRARDASEHESMPHLPVALRVYALADSQSDARPVVAALRREEALLFAYANPPEAGMTHLTVVAKDEAGEVYWLLPGPAPTGDASEPIRVAPNLLEIPVAIEVPWTSGAVTLHALFSERPLAARAVERWLETDAPASALPTGARALRSVSLEID